MDRLDKFVVLTLLASVPVITYWVACLPANFWVHIIASFRAGSQPSDKMTNDDGARSLRNVKRTFGIF